MKWHLLVHSDSSQGFSQYDMWYWGPQAYAHAYWTTTTVKFGIFLAAKRWRPRTKIQNLTTPRAIWSKVSSSFLNSQVMANYTSFELYRSEWSQTGEVGNPKKDFNSMIPTPQLGFRALFGHRKWSSSPAKALRSLVLVATAPKRLRPADTFQPSLQIYGARTILVTRINYSLKIVNK